MKLSQLVFKSMRKNMRHYYLYFFALIFSVTLFFSFVTLQYNESIITATETSGKATAGFEAASYMLYFVVLFFVLYANHLFIKRRSKEMGIYQLIGMTKGLVTRLIAYENILLFAGAVGIGMILGLLSSRLFAMILLKLIKIDAVVTMTFSKVAILNTLMVFSVLLIIILVQMAFMVHKTTLLSLFNAAKQADERVKRFSLWQMIAGAIGIVLIAYGYYKSTILFSGNTSSELVLSMVVILVSTIGGTYFVFRYSVSLVLNLLRLNKKGHLKLSDVLALTPIMHRMKGNAKSLTLITLLTAVSLAISTLSYITYYSASTSAKSQIPADFIALDGRDQAFIEALEQQNIDFDKKAFQISSVQFDAASIISSDTLNMLGGTALNDSIVIALSDYQQVDASATLTNGEAILTGYNSIYAMYMPLKAPFDLTFLRGQQEFPLHIKEVNDKEFLASAITSGGFVVIVEDAIFEQLQAINVEGYGYGIKQQVSIDLVDANEETYEQVEQFYKQTRANILSELDIPAEWNTISSQRVLTEDSLSLYGTIIFITAFLGLAFLLATGSIIYFKQMSEADEEAAAYTILRKIGFTEQEIIRGIMMKQAFNFGVPLLIGLLHSYFAVKSAWFLFGTELKTPLLITMALYIGMYVIFAVLTIKYYKKIIKQAL